MKLLSKFFFVQILCFALLIPEAPARSVGGGKARAGKAQAKPARTAKRPARQPSRAPSRARPASKPRNQFTGSKAARPTERPTASRPSRPQTRPAARPSRPSQPTTRPATRPSRPTTRPATRPTLPSNNRPDIADKRPQVRPETRPGNVKYPRPEKPMTLPGRGPGDNNRPGIANRPGDNNRPGIANRPGNTTRPGIGNNNRPGNNRPNRPNIGNNVDVGDINVGNRGPNVVRPGQNTRPIQRPNFNRPANNNRPGIGNGDRNWWNAGNRINSDNINVNINNNFERNINWSTDRNNWGYNPWWNRPATRPWYGGSWNCGWNNGYYRHHYHYHSHWGYRPPGYVIYDDDDFDVGQAIGWGLVGWGIGKLVFDTGYNTYRNPYPTQPVPTTSGQPVTYSQPITVVAAQTAPENEEAIAQATEQSESAIVESQEAFKAKNYLAALQSANQAVADAPGDGALHEYRALVLFALAKYSEAAGVLNPVLASGPGWDWTTMVTLYDSQDTYTQQLQKLEEYVQGKPDAADAHFLLGYHYMVCGHLDLAQEQFAEASKLQPADGVSQQLADLCAASSTSAEEDVVAEAGDEAPSETETPPAPDPVPLEKLTGTWVADRGEAGVITLQFKDDGSFDWSFSHDDQKSGFAGQFSMNDNGLLVLDGEESQLVAAVELPEDDELKFVLAGGPPGDQGLDFNKKA